MVRVGVIGYGYWGPNVVRNFAETPDCHLEAVSDARPDRLALAQRRYPTIRTFFDPNEMIDDPRIDAVAIATPVTSHFDLALRALQAGKHVLVEKPMTATTEQALRLIDEADRRGLTLAVDHTFVYTGAVQKIRNLIGSGDLGDIYYYDSVRVNLGLFQHDVDVIWDLGVHDLSILDYVMPSQPCAVSASGIRHVEGEPENIAYLTLHFERPVIAHLHVNWLAPVKVRRTLIGGSRKMIVYDDLEPSEKIRVYDKGVTTNGNGNGNGNGHGNGNGNGNGEKVYQMLVGYRTGDMWAPQLDMTEALRTELHHFVKCIDSRETPIADGQAGFRVVRILEAATASMAQRGRTVELDAKGCAV
jgi:predicted dehydrogenase